MNPEESSFSCIAKASSEWDNVVTWRGFNEIGKELKAVDIKCEKILKKELDTGLVKLWAGNSNCISEKYKTNF